MAQWIIHCCPGRVATICPAPSVSRIAAGVSVVIVIDPVNVVFSIFAAIAVGWPSPVCSMAPFAGTSTLADRDTKLPCGTVTAVPSICCGVRTITDVGLCVYAGGWIFTRLHIVSHADSFLYSLAAATVGAIIIVAIAHLFSSGT